MKQTMFAKAVQTRAVVSASQKRVLGRSRQLSFTSTLFLDCHRTSNPPPFDTFSHTPKIASNRNLRDKNDELG